MPLTILSIAYPYAPVGDSVVGGAERVLGDLDRALTADGHRSIVVACDGSNAAGTLHACPVPQGRLDRADRTWWRACYQAAIDRALATDRVDLVHLHGIDFHEYRLPKDVPVLVTLHMPAAWYAEDCFRTPGRNVTLQCVSYLQRALAPAALRHAPVVINGVALAAFDPHGIRGEYAVALGRICPEKNLHEALQAGTRAGIPVRVGGRVFAYSAHQEYFDERVAPELKANPGHRMLGIVPPADRHALLQRARCLLHPTLAPETSSLVAMEALAAGTPVIAYRSGALPEIIDDGITGYLVESVAEMAEAIGRASCLRSEDCRAAAEERFSRDRMIRDYFQLYRTLLHGNEARYA